MSKIVLGILETGLVDDNLKGQYDSYPQMFRQLFDAQDNSLQYKFYNVIDGEYPNDMDECDAYLITGSKSDSYSDDPWIERLRDYIRELNGKRKKMVGICFGHQIIAHALGGKAEKSDKGWGVGVYESAIVSEQSPPWLNGLDNFKLNLIHQDQVTSLPNSATVLAGNDFCRYSAYYIEDQVLCFQGHPEFSKDYTKALLASREQLIGEPTYSKAIESFSIPTDHHLIAKCIIDFIEYKQ